MFKEISLALLLILPLQTFTLAGAADGVDYSFEDAEEAQLRTTRAVFTEDVVQGIIAGGSYDSQELTEEEAQALAKTRGVTLPMQAASNAYGRPWVIVKAGIGIPNLVSAHVEIFVHRNWTVEAGAGFGLLPTVFEGSIRWRPDATCWGCDGKNFFSIGFGIDPGVYFGQSEGSNAQVGVMVTATVDLMYIHRFAKHFGFMIGSRLGVGAVTEFGGSRSWTNVEPTFKINLLQIGFVF